MIYSTTPPTELLLLGADHPNCLSLCITSYCKAMSPLSLHTMGWRAFQQAICHHQALVMLKLHTDKSFFSINVGDKLKIKTGEGVLLPSDCQDLPFSQLLRRDNIYPEWT